ncbi:HWE histidine kinase domain-containing protein [Sphingosinicella sp.]|uniref:HWE histidine kinase domain-containing protein n=1 Tax=Sphingosinicella sp. TaxID=1917971 RepID=UPI0017C049CF|nr:HWE histidine kinase domain-containing protein [Sphingosinicella sp.]MBA4759032.1 PAS domain S-box protein [Sphingosinicella sp.]
MNENTVAESDDSKRRLEGVVASAMDAIITINEEHRIVLFNPSAEQMFGVSTAEALGEPISRFIPERFRGTHEEHIRRFRNTGVTGRRMGALGAISGLRADGTEFPIEASISQVDIGGERLATVILRDITERLANEEARLLLAREVDHRAKNALAVVQALVSLTTAPTKEDFIAAVRGRVAALGRAHSLLAENRWQGGDLERIITDETAAYCKPGQVRAHGPQVALSPNAVQPISLLLHELATNATKHGALSTPGGSVDVSWASEADGKLKLNWAESGLRAVAPPTSHGFGSTLMDTVARQMGGEIECQWLPTGLKVTATLSPANFRLRSPEPSTKLGEESVVPSAIKGRVMIVEDELLVGMELSRALRDEGWDIMGPAGTLEEAFALLGQEDPPHAAILDINLNGQFVYPVADLLRAREVPFLFCSGYETAPSDDRYRDSMIIKKPMNLNVIIQELERLVDDPRGPETRRAA